MLQFVFLIDRAEQIVTLVNNDVYSPADFGSEKRYFLSASNKGAQICSRYGHTDLMIERTVISMV